MSYQMQQQHSKMGLEHNGTNENPSSFYFEYLEPFSSKEGENGPLSAPSIGTVSSVSRMRRVDGVPLRMGACREGVNETLECKSREGEEDAGQWQFLIIQSSQCANCSNYIGCEECLKDGDWYEWWAEDARCARRGVGGQGNSSAEGGAVSSPLP